MAEVGLGATVTEETLNSFTALKYGKTEAGGFAGPVLHFNMLNASATTTSEFRQAIDRQGMAGHAVPRRPLARTRLLESDGTLAWPSPIGDKLAAYLVDRRKDREEPAFMGPLSGPLPTATSTVQVQPSARRRASPDSVATGRSQE